MEEKENDWMSLKDMAERVKPTATWASLRAFIYEKEKNGSAHWVRKIGGKIFTSPSRFYEWIDKEGKV